MGQKKGLTKKQEQAALLLAQDEKSDEQIAAEVGIYRSMLSRWKTNPLFARRIDEHRDLWREKVLTTGIAIMENRVATYNDLAARLQQVIDERASDPSLVDIPGGQTGLIVAEPMLVKVYDGPAEDEDGPLMPTKQSRIVYKYSVDTGTLKELRATLQQAAQELGQWVDRREDTHDVTIRQRPDLEQLSDEELHVVERLAERALGPGRDSGGESAA